MKRIALSLMSALLFTNFTTILVLSSSDAVAEEKKQLYTCPMHPQVKSEQPGECPICHMKLEPIHSASAEEAAPISKDEKKIKFYRHPMNPSITSKVPAKDDMGMDYIPVYEDDAQSGNEVIQGRSSFSLTQEQANNVRLKTSKVETRDLTENLKASARVLGGSSVAIQVMEADALKIKTGQNFLFRSLSSNKEFRGKIVSVDSALDPMSRTVRVTGSLSSNSGLRSESSGTAVIEINLGKGLFVPEDAVLRTGETDLVYVIANSKIGPRKVQLGPKVDGGFQVLSGLDANEEVSTGSNFLLDSEARIRSAHD